MKQQPRKTTGACRRYGVRVKRSPIHGLGVFAIRRFTPDGGPIGVLEGQVLDPRRRSTWYTLQFFDHLGNEYLVEPDWPFKYLNHSKTPNAVLEAPVVVPLRVIEPGEEITIDYGEGWDE